MKRIWITAAAFAIAAWTAAAQTPEDATLRKLKAEMDQIVAQSKVIGLSGSVMNSTVKGAPYSGMEVTQSDQVLGDGTRIHNETLVNVYRDSQGRIRRETPDQITIMDPVAGATYFLDPKSQTVRKAVLNSARLFALSKKVEGAGGAATRVEVRSEDGVTTMMVDGKPVDPATVAKLKMSGDFSTEPMTLDAGPVTRMGVMSGTLPPPDTLFYKKIEKAAGPAESLGKQTLEGVESEGTRTTSTLPAGAIGNDRPIQTVSERWYSPELQTVMMSRHSDPRTGEETFRLINVTRGEPSPDLFQVPASYRTADKM